jgi:hypothetical protein
MGICREFAGSKVTRLFTRDGRGAGVEGIAPDVFGVRGDVVLILVDRARHDG